MSGSRLAALLLVVLVLAGVCHVGLHQADGQGDGCPVCLGLARAVLSVPAAEPIIPASVERAVPVTIPLPASVSTLPPPGRGPPL
ncbi:MAG: hypothetical protein D6702_08690 [Planctomycetota bacterium]|nr:MAG: hypothetical protein D6702_08690 [Planctomycetota bacterium]